MNTPDDDGEYFERQQFYAQALQMIQTAQWFEKIYVITTFEGGYSINSLQTQKNGFFDFP